MHEGTYKLCALDVNFIISQISRGILNVKVREVKITLESLFDLGIF